MYSLPSVVIDRKTQGDPVKLTAVGKLPEKKARRIFLKKKYLFQDHFTGGFSGRAALPVTVIIPDQVGVLFDAPGSREELFIGSVSAFSISPTEVVRAWIWFHCSAWSRFFRAAAKIWMQAAEESDRNKGQDHFHQKKAGTELCLDSFMMPPFCQCDEAGIPSRLRGTFREKW